MEVAGHVDVGREVIDRCAFPASSVALEVISLLLSSPTQTSPTLFPSASYAVINTGGSQFGSVITAAGGTGPYDPKATRWGDYSWAVLDPITDRFWMATEYVPPKSSQTTTRHRNWGTRVLEVSVS